MYEVYVLKKNVVMTSKELDDAFKTLVEYGIVSMYKSMCPQAWREATRKYKVRQQHILLSMVAKGVLDALPGKRWRFIGHKMRHICAYQRYHEVCEPAHAFCSPKINAFFRIPPNINTIFFFEKGKRTEAVESCAVLVSMLGHLCRDNDSKGTKLWQYTKLEAYGNI